MKRDDERHGTYAGFQTHKREGSQPCKACREARNEYMRKYRSTDKRWLQRQYARDRAMWRLVDRHREEYEALCQPRPDPSPPSEGRHRMNLRDILRGIPNLPDAACKGYGELGDIFYDLNVGGRRSVVPDDVKRLCGGCPERRACETWAREHGERHGAWGGKSFQGGISAVDALYPVDEEEAS